MQRIHFCWFRWPSVETTLSRELFVSRSSQDEFHHIKVDSYSKFCCSEWWLSAVSKDCFHHNWLRQRILLIREFWLLLTQSESFFFDPIREFCYCWPNQRVFVVVDPIREWWWRRQGWEGWWLMKRLQDSTFRLIFPNHFLQCQILSHLMNYCNGKFDPAKWYIKYDGYYRFDDENKCWIPKVAERPSPRDQLQSLIGSLKENKILVRQKKPYFSLMIIPNLHSDSVRRYFYQVSNKTIIQI